MPALLLYQIALSKDDGGRSHTLFSRELPLRREASPTGSHSRHFRSGVPLLYSGQTADTQTESRLAETGRAQLYTSTLPRRNAPSRRASLAALAGTDVEGWLQVERTV